MTSPNLSWPLQRVGEEIVYVIETSSSRTWVKEATDMLALGYRPITVQEALQRQVGLVQLGDFYNEDIVSAQGQARDQINWIRRVHNLDPSNPTQPLLESIDQCFQVASISPEERTIRMKQLNEDYKILSAAQECARELHDEVARRAVSVVNCAKSIDRRSSLFPAPLPEVIPELDLPGHSLLYQIYTEIVQKRKGGTRERGTPALETLEDEGVLTALYNTVHRTRNGKNCIYRHATSLSADKFDQFLLKLQEVVLYREQGWGHDRAFNPENLRILERDVFSYIPLVDEWAYKLRGKEDQDAARSWVGQQILASQEINPRQIFGRRVIEEREERREERILIPEESLFPATLVVEKLIDETIARCERRKELVVKVREVRERYKDHQLIYGPGALSMQGDKGVGVIGQQITRLDTLRRLETEYKPQIQEISDLKEQAPQREIPPNKKEEWQLYAAGSPLVLSDLVARGFDQQRNLLIKIIPNGLALYPELLNERNNQEVRTERTNGQFPMSIRPAQGRIVIDQERYTAIEGREIVIAHSDLQRQREQAKDTITLQGLPGLKIRLDPVWSALVPDYATLFSLQELEQDKRKNRYPAPEKREQPHDLELEIDINCLYQQISGFFIDPIIINPFLGDHSFRVGCHGGSRRSADSPRLQVGVYKGSPRLIGKE